MPAEIHLGDVGTTIQITISDGTNAVDISAATVKNIIFVDPDDASQTKAGTFVTDGTDGKLKYVTEVDFLDLVGVWQVQVDLQWAGGNHWHSSVGEFRVHPNLV